MATQDFKRKLTAILSADVEGYTRLMGEDEEATVRTITAYREVMTTLIKQHNGKVVDSPGDNLLAEFASVVDAVQCAVAIQKEINARNTELPENRQMHFRIGINLGDVIQEGDRIYGDGVNIAARLEGLAEPGGICVSKTAFDHIESKLPYGYDFIGDQTVKNISKPVGAYRVLMDSRVTVAGKPKERKLAPKRQSQILVGAVAVLVLVVAAGIWQFYMRRPSVEPASVEKMASPLPEKLSIAVLPFTNMSGDPKQEYFSDGITEEIITQLARFPDVHVIARNSTFTYKGKPVKVQQVGQELGVRYVLEGSVLRSGDRIRITAQLVDAATGGHIWAERYDRESEGIFALQDDISQHIAAALGSSTGALEIAERKRVMSSDPNNLSAFETFLRATEHFHRLTKDDNLKARKLAIKATELKPDYAQAYGGVGWTHLIDYFFRWTESPEQSLDQAFEWAQKALAIDHTDYESYWLLSRIYTRQKKYDKALASAQRALALNPNSALLLNSLGGNVFTYLGRAGEAVEMIEKAMRLDPRHPNSWYGGLGRACYAAGQYEKAVKALKQIGKPKLHLRLYLAASYAQLGQTEEAHAEIAQILNIDPKVSVDIWAEREPYKNPVDKERWIDGLRKAGLPDKPPLQLPDKPSVAVLPFTNMSDDPKQEYFSDGLTDQIISSLSKIPYLFVIARNSTFTYKGKPVKVQKVAEDLGVQYVLEGSVQKTADRIRITAQLIEATKGHHLWSQRYDRNLKLEDIFAIQDDITMEIMKAMQVKLTRGEQAHQWVKHETTNLESYEKFQEARAYTLRFTKEDVARGRQLFEEAIALDPKFASAYAFLGWTYFYDARFGWAESRGKSANMAFEYAQKALEMDNTLDYAHTLLSAVYLVKRQHDKAITEAERAVALNPNTAHSLGTLAGVLGCSGRWEESIIYFKKATRVDPFPPITYLTWLGRAYFMTEQYDKAIPIVKKALNRNTNYLPAQAFLAASYISLGRESEAVAAAKEVLRINPKFSLESYSKTLPYKNNADIERYVAALRKSGLK